MRISKLVSLDFERDVNVQIKVECEDFLPHPEVLMYHLANRSVEAFAEYYRCSTQQLEETEAHIKRLAEMHASKLTP